MLTESQMRRGVLELHQQTAAEVKRSGPQDAGTGGIHRVGGGYQPGGVPQVEVAGLKTAADDVATRINGDVENAFATMFEQIGSGAAPAKDALADFARSVISAINRIAAGRNLPRSCSADE